MLLSGLVVPIFSDDKGDVIILNAQRTAFVDEVNILINGICPHLKIQRCCLLERS